MPNGYSVGNLELDITALDKSATSLNNVISRLQSMLNLVSPISASLKTLRTDMSAISRLKFGSFDRLATGLNSLSRVNTQGLYTKLNSISRILTPLKELSAGMTSIGSVNTFANGLQKIVKLDVAGFDTQIKALTASLRPFLQEITVATPALTAFATAMASVKGRRMINFKQFDQTGGSGKNLAKTLNLASVLGKIYFIRNYTKQLANTMVGLVQNAINYTETLNLWQVAMRGNISTAEEFISKMNKAYGIAEETLMRYQATFRNMLSTLGGISTDVSYGLSEYLTQMALDYASLYNTSIEKAMTVFQSVLSGQVRPIRSISGYDITETTIFELYQQLGGTKTMRQLTQTEKRLLRIYAVFQQMDRSGAIGDLNKTLNNTANQIRIMGEASKELGVWLGKLVEIYIAPMLPYLNAFLITAKNIAQAIVKSLPEYSEFDGTIKGYEETAEAMEQVNGKLLDFDKFRSLSGSEENSLGLGIDEKLIEGLTQYQSILANVSNKATELAEKWTKWWIDDDGGFTDQAENLFTVLKSIGIVVGTLVGYKLITKIGSLAGAITGLTTGMKLLNGVLAVGIIASFIKMFELFEEGNILGGIFAGLIGVTLVGAFYKLNAQALITFWQTLGKKVIPMIMSTILSFGGLKAMILSVASSAVTFGLAFMGAWAILSILPDGAQKVVGAIMAIAGAFMALTTAILAYKGIMTWGTALPVLTASIGAAIAGGIAWKGQLKDISQFKNGGLVEDGLFTMNKGEVMGTFDDGTSIVANNQQIISGIKQGVYQAVSSALQANGSHDDRPIDIYIDGERVFQATKKNAKRHGLAFSKV